MIKVSNDVQVYEVDSIEKDEQELIVVTSHFPKKNFVILYVDGTSYAVLGSDLKTAIDNALNSNA